MNGLNWVQQLQEYNSKFDFTADLSQKKKEVFSLVLKNPNAVEFDLMMAKAAYQLNYPLYVPSPTNYLSSINVNDIANFFKRLKGIGSFVSELKEVAKKLTSRKRVNDEDNLLMDLVKNGGNVDKFFQLLHFTLFTNIMKLNELDAPWYNEIPCQRVQVFHCCYTSEEEERFKVKGMQSEFLFHGTFEHNVYSIMRNGIRGGYSGTVFMSNSINLSLGYARSLNKVILIFEVRGNKIDPCALVHCCFPTSQLMLRSIIWIEASSISKVPMVADKVVLDIKKKVQG